MADRGDTDGVLFVGQLIDAVGAHAQRAQAAEPATQRVPCVRLALEQSERGSRLAVAGDQNVIAPLSELLCDRCRAHCRRGPPPARGPQMLPAGKNRIQACWSSRQRQSSAVPSVGEAA
jgi:hypothetical protein